MWNAWFSKFARSLPLKLRTRRTHEYRSRVLTLFLYFFLSLFSFFFPPFQFFFFPPLEQKRCRVLINATNPAKSEILVTRFSIVEKNYRGIVRQTWRLLPTAVLIMYGWKPWIETVILKYYFVSDVFTSSSTLRSVFRRFRKSARLLWTIGRNYQRIFTISPWLKIEEKHRNESLLKKRPAETAKCPQMLRAPWSERKFDKLSPFSWTNLSCSSRHARMGRSFCFLEENDGKRHSGKIGQLL